MTMHSAMQKRINYKYLLEPENTQLRNKNKNIFIIYTVFSVQLPYPHVAAKQAACCLIRCSNDVLSLHLAPPYL